MSFQVTTTGLTELTAKLNGLPAALKTGMVGWVEAVSAHAAERSELLAPIKTGRLRHFLRPMPTVTGASEVKGGVEDLMAYAYTVHENVTPAGPKGLGAASQQQPSQPEGPVGGWYITRAVNYNVQHYEQELGRYVEAVLSGNRVSGKSTLPQTTFSQRGGMTGEQERLLQGVLGARDVGVTE